MQSGNNCEEHSSSLLRRQGVAVWLVVGVLTFNVACDTQVRSEVRPAQKEAPATSSRDVVALCDSIKDIEMLPMKDEAVPDPAYNALISAGEEAIPCLIRKITDETRMKDPRQAPTVRFVLVGDTAFFLLVRVANIDFVELMPPDVRKVYEGDQGIYGYFKYINENNNRKKLQDAAAKWYEKKYGRSLP